MWFRSNPERSENLRFELVFKELDKEGIKKLRDYFPNHYFSEAAVHTVSWDLNIDYYGVVKCLEQLEYFLDVGKCKFAKTTELNHTKCLLQDLLAKIEKIEQKYG